MSQDHSGSDASLRGLLFELMATAPGTLGMPGMRMKRPKPRVQIKPQNYTNADKLPEYGLGDIETYATDYLDIKLLTKLAETIQGRHELMGLFKTRNIEELRRFITETCGPSLPPGHALNPTDADLEALGSPVIELALLFYEYHNDAKDKPLKSLIPTQESIVITSVATAGSAEPAELVMLLNALGVSCNPLVLKTTLLNGLTARTSRKPPTRDILVTYDQETVEDKWSALSQNLYDQLCTDTNQNKKYLHADFIFHWGCISHYETRTPSGDTVEGWAHHEHWNMLYCIAMARHALEHLKPGGTLVLKVRIFKNTETHGLVAILACAFTSFKIYSNSRMPAEFAIFVGVGFQGDDIGTVKRAKQLLKESTSYESVSILCHDLTPHQTYKEALQRASAVRAEMRRDHDHVAFIMNHIMYWIDKVCRERREFPFIDLTKKLKILNSTTPVTIDNNWIPVVEKTIREIITTITPQQKVKLRDYVNKFALKFR